MALIGIAEEKPNRVIFLRDNTGTDDFTEGYIFTQDGNKVVAVSGDFNGADLQFEMEAEGGWVPIAGGLFTEPESRTFLGITKGIKIRAKVSRTPAGLYAEMTK